MTPKDFESFLSAHVEWCERQIQFEIARGLTDLTWLEDDLASSAVAFLSRPGAPPAEQFFRERLRRSLLAKYSQLGFSTNVLRRSNESTGSSEFERFVRERFDESARGGWRPDYPGARVSKKVVKEIRMDADLRFVEEKGIGYVSNDCVQGWHVRTYLTADRRGFTYWHDIAAEPEGRAVFRESFRSWFGLGWDTSFRKFDEHEAPKVASFVLGKIRLYREFLRGLPAR